MLVVIFFVLFMCIKRKQWWTSAHCFLFSFCLCAPKEDNDQSTLVVIFFCFVSMHPKKTTTSQHSLSSCFVFVHLKKTMTNPHSSFVLFCFVLCTQRRQQRINAHCHLLLFCFCAPRKDNDKPMSIIAFFLFCFCAPILNNYKPCLSLAHHCFHSMWIPQKMIKGLLFFFFFMDYKRWRVGKACHCLLFFWWATDNDKLSRFVIIFFCCWKSRQHMLI